MPIMTVLLNDQEIKLDVSAGASIYEEAANKGTILPHGCLAGACGACRTEILANPENLEKPGHVEEDTIKHILEDYAKRKGDDYTKGRTLRLACRAKLKGDITIKPFR